MAYKEKHGIKIPNAQNNTGEDCDEETSAKGIEWVLLGFLAILIWAGFKHYVDVPLYIFLAIGLLSVKTEGGRHW